MGERQGYQIFDQLDMLLTGFYFSNRVSAVKYVENNLQIPYDETVVIKLMDIPEGY